jgi:hypothetical protein
MISLSVYCSLDMTLSCKDGRVCRVGFCVGHVEDEDSSSQTVRNKSDHEHLSATVVARPLTARQRMRETAGMY